MHESSDDSGWFSLACVKRYAGGASQAGNGSPVDAWGLFLAGWELTLAPGLPRAGASYRPDPEPSAGPTGARSRPGSFIVGSHPTG
jgi:hypothetical protein